MPSDATHAKHAPVNDSLEGSLEVTSTEAALEASRALHARVREVIDARSFERPLEPSFDELARALAVFQATHVAGYGRLCAARAIDVQRAPIEQLPAVPTDAFRLARVAAFGPEHDVRVFRTSGTTQAARGEHALRTLDTYHAAALGWARETLFFPWNATRPPLVVAIGPTPGELGDSSLACMMGWFVDELGAPGSCFLSPTDPAGVAVRLRGLAAREVPIVVLATAFAYVHLVDELGAEVVRLPEGSRAMQTGGFKGRSREIPIDALRSMIARAFAISEGAVVGEYGMTELSSQLYAVADSDESSSRFLYRAPPWMRVSARAPGDLSPLPTGQRGLARFEDLANVDSAWAVQTADEIVVRDDGAIDLLGRAPGAVPRGCSLAIEELLGR